MRRAVRAAAATLALVAAAAGRGSAQPPPGGAGPRPALERLAAVVQRQLGLSDEQAARLRDATRRFAVQRDQLVREERAARLELRAAVRARDTTDQARVARLLDDVLRHQQRRLELVAEEQRELAKFLTPLQRAQFMALQERATRMAQQLRAQRQRAADAAVPVPDPPRRRPPPR